MSNMVALCINEVKELIDDLSLSSETLKNKINHVKDGATDFLNSLQADIEEVKKHLNELLTLISESLHSLVAALQNSSLKIASAEQSFEEMFQNKFESIKQIVDKILETGKSADINLGDVFDVSKLKVKLGAVYARIFLRQVSSQLVEKMEN